MLELMLIQYPYIFSTIPGIILSSHGYSMLMSFIVDIRYCTSILYFVFHYFQESNLAKDF